MLERANQEQAPRRRMRWLLTRGLIVVGGAIAGTAAVWALSSATASADTLSAPSQHALGTAVHDVTARVATIHNGVRDITGRAGHVGPAALHAGIDAGIDAARGGVADLRVAHLHDDVSRGGAQLVHAVGRTAGAAADTAVAVLRDPKGTAEDAAAGVATGTGKAIHRLAAGWHHVTHRLAPIGSRPSLADGVGDVGDVGDVVGSAIAPVGTHAANRPAAQAAPGPERVPGAAPAPVALDASPRAASARPYQVRTAHPEVASYPATGRGHHSPRAPTHEPVAPATVPVGSGTGGQSNSGSGSGVLAAAPGDVITPGIVTSRNPGSGARTPSGQPGRQPGCTPD